MTTVYAVHPSPIGPLLLVGERSGGAAGAPPERISGVHMDGDRYFAGIGSDWVEDAAAFADARRQLDEYFAGTRTRFDLPLEPHGSPFQLAVWQALRSIPPGTTTTYGDIAARIGRPGAARAVGGAIGRNPIAVVVPCHRVVGADGTLTGFGGGLDRKRALLALEGIAGVEVVARAG